MTVVLIGAFIAYGMVGGGVSARLDHFNRFKPDCIPSLSTSRILLCGLFWPALLLFTIGFKIGGMSK